MVEVAGDEGSRRRLPLWMQGKASKPGDDGDKNDNVQEDGDGLVSGNSKPKKQSKKAALPQEKGKTSSGVFCSAKKKTISVRLRNGKDSKIPSPIDDDKELTPEDLLSIAEEYVKADKDVVMQDLSIKECEFGSRTGDPAQDMLDLFLGPFLKKTVEEKTTEFHEGSDIFQ
ncbi:hypothetical protein CRYUN_Cryun04dG0184500 [Craigia yunnanensis]